MRYFDWVANDVATALQDPRMDKIKQAITQDIQRDLLTPGYADYWYRYEKSWLERWLSLDDEAQQAAILELGWGPLGPTEDPDRALIVFALAAAKQCRKRAQNEDGVTDSADDSSPFQELSEARNACVSACADYHDWQIVMQPQWRDPQTIQHWAWLHNCKVMVLFIWRLVSILRPTATLFIRWDGFHAYVMERGDPHTVYDILWYTTGVPIAKIEGSADEGVTYTNPIAFLACDYLDLPAYPDTSEAPAATLEDIERYHAALL